MAEFCFVLANRNLKHLSNFSVHGIFRSLMIIFILMMVLDLSLLAINDIEFDCNRHCRGCQ